MQPVVPSHGTVCRLGLDRLPVGGHQDRGHEPERAVALGDRVGLHVAVVVLARPQVAAVPLEARGYHVVDQAVLVGKFRCVKLALELFLENLLEQILETAIVDFENGVFGGEIYRILALQAVVETGAREAADRLVQIEHRQADARARGLEHLALDRRSAARGLERELDRSRAVKLDLGGARMVPEAVTGDDDREIPVGNDTRNVLADDGLPENRPVENIADGAVWAPPHLLEVELLDAPFVRGDGRAFHCHPALPCGVGRVDRDLVVGLVSRLDPEIVVFQLDIQIREDQFLADRLPDDPRHFVTVHLDDRILDFDFAHGKLLQSRFERDRRCDLTAIAAAKTTGLPLLAGRYYSQFDALLRVKGKIDSYLIFKMKKDFPICVADAMLTRLSTSGRAGRYWEGLV